MNHAVAELETNAVSHPRTVERLVAGQAVMEGAGVKITRVLTQSLQRRLDPYLMLDAFRSDDPNEYMAGFPEHPHRGIETITLMVSGRSRHRDSAGHEGLLLSGGVQWMVAGRGVLHSEMPEQENGVMEGFQLWLNLPAQDKMTAPWYRDIPAGEIPQFTTPEGVQVRVIAGASHGVAGAVERPVTEPLYLDLTLPAGAAFSQVLPAEHNAFVYVYRGELDVGGKAVAEKQMALLANTPRSDGVILRAAADAAGLTRALLIGGKPLGQPIAQYGPFVMNTQEEIIATLHDLREGRFLAPA
jgi:redox-sensitive bicupin YhaK (pirin superfamily)